MKGAFYGRYSSEGQSIRAQRSSVLNLAKKYKVQITKEFLDEGVSAIENELYERAGIMELLNQVEQKQFDFIAIQFSDRIARDPIEHIEIKQHLQEIGIPVVISATETVYDTDINNLNQLMMDGFAKFEVDNIKQRTLDGLKARVTMGKFSGGNSPYGYKYVKRQARFETIPEEIEITKTIFDLYKKGEGTQSIAEKLPPKTSRTTKWTREKVRSILLNPFYAGFVSYNKRSKNTTALINDRELWIMVEAEYITPLISKEEWEICWRIYNERRKKKVDPKFLKTSFLLRGLVRCEECKQLLKTKDQRTTSNTNKVYGKAI